MKTDFILKGNICYSKNSTELATYEQSYVVCEGGISRGVYGKIPEKYSNLPVEDCGNQLIIPGFSDLHVHAPQYPFRASGMDMELLDWLNTYTFPEESRYQDLEYAKKMYTRFVDDLRRSGTTRACIFGTMHVEATELLMELLESSGLVSFVGKVNMDRNSPEYLCERTAEDAAKNTREWLEKVTDRFPHTKPILTPRFTPTCSDELMRNLKKIQQEYQLPMQSHLSENLSEIDWVKELCPASEFYGDAYDMFGLFGRDVKTIMAHCVHSGEDEQRRMKENGVFIAHCPESNTNLASGVAPVKKYLMDGQRVGLGSDVAAGSTTSLFHAMSQAIQASKLRWRLLDESYGPLTAEEAFYLTTKGGGAFFGKAGSLENGYTFDALVVDDSAWDLPGRYGIRDRVERMIYLADETCIRQKYVDGRKICL